ncbi:hypothetical protein BDM02DRAFT_3186850 [Thelephora ganbajun]|uniref:Uncharacterized protein n=1 Tax=Thelephora ganbajun TaxID=370292 RepID=A0ACB6ZGG0_THEGA|nr:hypothetical protein BDM02DRAFT_3186850 [Thelephora ganbajun]
MPSQTRPTAAHNLSPFERCAPEILQRIALFAVEERLLGPPSDLLALLTTSTTINFALSPGKDNNLCARIFALKFDTAASSRRLTERWLTSKSLATELRHRFEVLKRIRGGVIDGYTLQYDLWTVFLIVLEHDRKNALQLTQWAGAHTFACRVAERWLNDGYEPDFGENVGGLVCTIIWELSALAELTEPLRRKLQDLFRVHVLCGYRFSLFYASEEFFDVKGQPEELEERVRGKPPASTQVQYYGHTITIAAPPLASACLLVFLTATQPNALRYTPGYMEQYVPGRTFSERMDEEWHRLVMCHSINTASNPLGGKRFTPSALVGLWKGTVLVPNFVAFLAFLHSNQRRDPRTIHMNFFAAEMELREHHCLGDEIRLLPGLGPGGIGEDPLNAWFPQNTTFNEHNDTLEAYDPTEDHSAVYQTYRVDAKNPYASGHVPETRWVSDDGADSEEEELEQLEAEITNNEPDIPDETQGLVNNPSYIDDDDQWEDTVEHRDSGIRDIIVTGTSLPMRALRAC